LPPLPYTTLFRSIHARPNVSRKLSVRVIARYPLVRNPTIFAIITSQPVLHHKRFACIECLRVNLETFLQIVWMYAFGPAIAQFLLQATARKLQPRFVKEGVEFVYSGHPD